MKAAPLWSRPHPSVQAKSSCSNSSCNGDILTLLERRIYHHTMTKSRHHLSLRSVYHSTIYGVSISVNMGFRCVVRFPNSISGKTRTNPGSWRHWTRLLCCTLCSVCAATRTGECPSRLLVRHQIVLTE